MSFKKFEENDIFFNQVEAHPQVSFFIHNGTYYLNQEAPISGAFVDPIKHVPSGYVSLYEMNIDRQPEQLIYPFLVKNGTYSSFKTVTNSDFNSQFLYGDILTDSYPLSASISRYYFSQGESRPYVDALNTALKNKTVHSPHYEVSSSLLGRDFGSDIVNMVSIPSIMYGSSIRKGTVELSFFVTGTLVGKACDIYKNGALVQTGPEGSPGSGSVVGIVLYEEGVMFLTGTTALSSHTENYLPSIGSQSPAWVHFGTTSPNPVPLSSFLMEFDGTTYISTLTMHAHAFKNEFDYSTNQSFVTFGSSTGSYTDGNFGYSESPERELKNVVSSSYQGFEAPFQKITYISKIGIYDEDRNLIGIAKLANPIRKRRIDEYTFKLKLDI